MGYKNKGGVRATISLVRIGIVSPVVGAPGVEPILKAQQTAYCEIGSTETLKGKNKVFPVERRGGYPWAEGTLGQNLHAQLPLKLAYDGRPSEIKVYFAEDLSESAKQKRDVSLRITIFDSEPGDKLDVKLNGKLLDEGSFDYDWKDRKIFSPLPNAPTVSTGYFLLTGSSILAKSHACRGVHCDPTFDNTL